MLKRLFTLDERPLHTQWLFWISSSIPILIGLCLGGKIWKDYTFEVSVKAFDEFLRISTLPLSIMAISLPLAALISRLHNSMNLEHKARDQKNDVDEKVIEHIKEFIEYIKDDLINKESGFSPINKNQHWANAASKLLRLVSLRNSLYLRENKQLADDYIDNLRLYLNRHLSYQGYGRPLPASFFFGISDWQDAYVEKRPLAQSHRESGNSVVVYGSKDIIECPYGKLPPALTISSINEKAIAIVYEFIELGEDFNQKAEKCNFDYRFWEKWKPLKEGDVTLDISLGARKYIHFTLTHRLK